MKAFIEKMFGIQLTEELWQSIAVGAIKIVLILVIGRLFVWFLHKTINRVVLDKLSVKHPSQKRRILTVGKLLKNTVSYGGYFIMGLLILSELGISLGPLIAGAGVVGIAIGFGAQSLVKDVITGFFIVLEDQFAVGDVISTGKFKGTVEVIGLRATRLVNENGEVHIVPNNLINEITNYSVLSSKVIIDIAIAYNGNLHHIMQVVKQCADKLAHEHILETPNVLGLQQFGKDEIVMRVEARCEATYEDEVRRYMNEQLKLTLEQHHLQMNDKLDTES